ncbi:DUF1223 domain-containing protein [Acidicapsa dinghuensis]|uniref:DUF1223 domain-containing protein n=1 Tax=Acidicapsa dinghuensis TaxID=2218256 RepID=A0ABW1EM45_9BACT|nr:DUF1223 domain-containing protein [Acidicapsa dinghuensis]
MKRIGWWIGVGLGVVVIAAAVAWAAQGAQAAQSGAGTQSKPVLVELFTSEGCSSCPPADALLAKLDEAQPIQGVHAIVLSEHVTYWDHEGWRDPFSLDAVTYRQKWYGDKFGLDDVYTPQAIVDGAVQFVGSDGHKLTQALVSAAANAKEELNISSATWAGDSVQFVVHRTDHDAKNVKTTLVAALAIDSAETSVKSGENAGRTLHNVAVVRVLKELGSDASDGRQLTLKLPDASSTPLRLVVFLVDKRTGHVLGAAEQMVQHS